ncbi:glutathione S-transferase family protein [Emcibacter sp. SYSU 3D8]|uniref:glutathione S-transferase family protein n=1 Tax=Emcibacter sp. SYSU 3D8 TaxID=3133969 RepID=UPI0031FE5A01
MSAVKIYGTPGSRANRTLWLAEELKQETGFDYQMVPTHFMDDAKKPEYLAINPNGRVPAMDDDGYILFESLAINLYLVKKAGGSLAPKDLHEEGKAIQWSMWALTELEDAFIALLVRHPKIAFMPPDPKIEADMRLKLERPLKVLEQHLSRNSNMLGDRFTVADVNVAGVMSMSQIMDFDYSPYPSVSKWFGACMARPAVAASRAL